MWLFRNNNPVHDVIIGYNCYKTVFLSGTAAAPFDAAGFEDL